MLPWPLPYPQPVLPPFTIPVEEIFFKAQSLIASMRKRRNIPALNPDGQILLGQEQLSRELSPPYCIVIPTGATFEPARKLRDGIEPEMLEGQWLEFEAHCWGYEDPDSRTSTYSFSTAVEVWRELYWSLTLVNGGVPNVRASMGEWVQKTDINRLGRVLVVRFALRTWLTADPPIFAPFATTGVPGIEISVDGNLQNTLQNPTSTVTEAVFVVP